MLDKSQDINYIREYLKYALEFEKYVYIWENALKDYNNAMSVTLKNKELLQDLSAAAQLELNNLSEENRQQTENMQSIKEKNERKNNTANTLIGIVVTVLVIALILMFILVFSISKDFFISLFGAVFMCIGVFALCLPFIKITKKLKYSYKQTENIDIAEMVNSSTRRREIILQDKIEETNEKLKNIYIKENIIEKNRAELLSAYETSKNNLANLYDKNIIPVKYRCLNAVATLYEYLVTGRCNAIYGHGGIYDTYENDLKLGYIIANLQNINNRLASIENYQRTLYNEICSANNILMDINNNINNIDNKLGKIEENSRISALANQQTAYHAGWINYEMRFGNWF